MSNAKKVLQRPRIRSLKAPIVRKPDGATFRVATIQIEDTRVKSLNRVYVRQA